MNSDRIKEIQKATAHPESQSVQWALLQVWNECQQEFEQQTSELQSKINQLESENKELREFLRISVDIIESFGNVEPYSLTEKELEYITQAKQLLNK